MVIPKAVTAINDEPMALIIGKPVDATRGFFGLTLAQARTIIKEVVTVTSNWRDAAKAVGAPSAEINRMASAFGHDDLKRALAL